MEWNVEDLVVSQAFANEGPTLKRFRPRAKVLQVQLTKEQVTSLSFLVTTNNKN